MKRLVALVISVAILAAVAAPAFAQQRNCRRDSRTYSSRNYDSQGYSQGYYGNSGYYDNRSYYDYGYDNRSFWQKHRDKLTVAIGTGAGAAIGAILGGKRGAAMGALAGAGGSALYAYRIRNRRYGY
jgi:hypothetical protein